MGFAGAKGPTGGSLDVVIPRAQSTGVPFATHCRNSPQGPAQPGPHDRDQTAPVPGPAYDVRESRHEHHEHHDHDDHDHHHDYHGLTGSS
jgi:hypothetical protein